MSTPHPPDPSSMFIWSILVVLGTVLSVVGWLRYFRLA
jgi:hypothetical protein